MADQNVIAITGRIGQDPTLRQAGDTQVLSFNVANGIYKKGEGDYNTRTTWYTVTVFGARAATLEGLLHKGSRVGVTGVHSLRPYTDKDGNERQSNEINASEVTLMDKREDTDDQPQRTTARTQPASAPKARPAQRNTPQPVDDFDDSIPF